MRTLLFAVTATVLLSASGSTAFGAGDLKCEKMSGNDKASCMDHAAKSKGPAAKSREMRGTGSQGKGRGAEKGNADHGDHDHPSQTNPEKK